MSEAPQGPPGPKEKIDSEHARILAEVLDDQAKKQAARSAVAPVRKGSETRFFVQVALMVSGTFFFYLLFFSPTWVTPTAAEPLAQETADSGIRTAIWLSAQQVENFHLQEGRLPDNNRELGLDPVKGVEYERIDALTYRLVGTTGDLSLTYVSTEDINEFLGDAVGILMGGPSQ